MICGLDEPARTRWRPTPSRRTTGETPSSVVTRAAEPPTTSSRTGRPFFRWPWNFIPSFGSEPPPTTTTLRNTPEATSAPAITSAGTGAAQKFFTSAPDAWPSPAASAMALAMLPPPRW